MSIATNRLHGSGRVSADGDGDAISDNDGNNCTNTWSTLRILIREKALRRAADFS